MSIYRGAGGAGDAVNDSSSEATLVAQLVVEAQADAAAAQASATAASGSATTASTAATNASNSATNAATSATNASNSASTATTQASNASTSATAAAASATSASNSATTATTQATNASTSASGASSSATNASNSATTASTQATNAAASASAASTSATNAASSATSASGSATSATSSASSASTSATNAAASSTSATNSASTATTQAGIATTQATNAASSASAASTSASNAATSATNASNSASTATTQASNASTSASNAATSEANAAASYDSFDDRYLGPKSTAPTVDNDGNTLLTGALYYNTTSSSMKVWSGSAWLDAYASLSGALIATNNLSDLNNTTSARTNLGVTATGADTTYAYRANNLSDLSSASTARTNLGLGTAATTASTAYATAAQGTNADTALADRFKWDGGATGLVAATGRTSLGVTATGSDTTYAYRANNLSDLASASTARTNLGLGTAATTASSDYLTSANPSYTGTLTGGTGVVNLGSGQFYKDASGNVGVGTSNPSTYGIFASVANSNGYVNTGNFINSSNGSGAVNRILMGNDSSNGAAQFVLYSSTHSTFPNILDINNANSAALRFLTNNTERVRITSGGNVGIGTSSPTIKLVTIGEMGTQFSTNDSILKFGNNGTVASISATYGTTGSYVPIQFLTSDTERMRITSTGDVGIGTTAPAAKLVVATNSANGASTLNWTTGNTLLLDNSDTTYNATSVAKLVFNTTAGGYNNGGIIYAGGGGGFNSGFLGFATGWNSSSLATERMRISSAGNLLVNSTVGTLPLSVQGTSGGAAAAMFTGGAAGVANDLIYFYSSGQASLIGYIGYNGSVVTYNVTSDYRLKDNIAPITGALAKIAQLKPVTYTWKLNNANGQGFIAHELAEVFPDAVSGKKDGMFKDGKIKPQGIDTSILVATLTAAIQEQQALIENLTTRLNALEGK